MKRFAFLISIMAIFAAMFMLSSCEKNKLPEGTGSLAVHVSSPKYDCEVRVYPYVADDLPRPIASQAIKAGTSQIVTFTLNVGDYIVDRWRIEGVCGKSYMHGIVRAFYWF